MNEKFLCTALSTPPPKNKAQLRKWSGLTKLSAADLPLELIFQRTTPGPLQTLSLALWSSSL